MASMASPSASSEDSSTIRPVTTKEMASASTASFTIEEIISPDGKVDMRLLMLALWKNRKNTQFTTALCQRLSYLTIDKPVLDEAEFYLPQLAHMVVHLDKELPIETVEQFVFLLSQSSVHFALQFFWIVYAALDENRPKRNGNPRTFDRCAQLLLALEQCFIYGSPVAKQATELLTRQSISEVEMEQILMADRRFFAAQSSMDSNDFAMDKECTEGWLFKKGGGTRTMGRRNWKLRWCRIEKRMLLVFDAPTSPLPRTAVPLDRAEVRVVENTKHPFYFEILHSFSETKVKLAARNEEELGRWITQLQKNAAAPDPPMSTSPRKTHTGRMLARMSIAMRSFILESSNSMAEGSRNSSPVKADAISTAETLSDRFRQTLSSDSTDGSRSTTTTCDSFMLQVPTQTLLSDQQRRYEFFSGMIHFVKAITDISERIRRVEPAKRKPLLPVQLQQLRIPPKAYLPLCKSTDRYCNVTSVFVNEGRVFNTNERAPCLLYFETEESESGADVSKELFTYLYGSAEEELPDDDVAVNVNEADILIASGILPPPPPAKLTNSDSDSTMSPFLRELLANNERKQQLEKIFGELSFTTTERLKATCPNPSPSWKLGVLIAKSFDDLRQEVLVMQLISYFHQIFQAEGLPLRLHPYRILSTGASTGIIEVVRNATSLDAIKKTPGFKNLRRHFEQLYGEPNSDNSEFLQQAELNFIHSLAAYSIVCYILSIKDRHNGNIMLDVEGHVVHIDFGFFLGRAPGGSFSFETAPFKLTAEMVDVLGGRQSTNFQYFTELCVRGALAARKHGDTIYTLVEVMSFQSKLPCFAGNTSGLLAGLRERLFLNMVEENVASTVVAMVKRSYDHFGTNKYDQFQVFSNGIAR